MILSRFAERVKKQYRADAFIQSAIVIPGVFIGLQIQRSGHGTA